MFQSIGAAIGFDCRERDAGIEQVRSALSGIRSDAAGTLESGNRGLIWLSQA